MWNDQLHKDCRGKLNLTAVMNTGKTIVYHGFLDAACNQVPVPGKGHLSLAPQFKYPDGALIAFAIPALPLQLFRAALRKQLNWDASFQPIQDWLDKFMPLDEEFQLECDPHLPSVIYTVGYMMTEAAFEQYLSMIEQIKACRAELAPRCLTPGSSKSGRFF